MESNSDSSQLADSERSELIERMVVDIMHKQHCKKVSDIVTNLQKLDKWVGVDEIHAAARRLERKGVMNVSEERVPLSFFRNLAKLESNAPFWIAIFTSAAVMAAIYIVPMGELGMIVRRIAGALFLFVIPGYTITNFFIQRNRLSSIERVAVSVGLSLAIVAVIGIMLSYSLIGVTIEAVIAFVASFIVALAFLASYKDYLARQRAHRVHKDFLNEPE